MVTFYVPFLPSIQNRHGHVISQKREHFSLVHALIFEPTRVFFLFGRAYFVSDRLGPNDEKSLRSIKKDNEKSLSSFKCSDFSCLFFIFKDC